MGHEERFPPTRLSAGYGFRKETIAGMRRNGRDAPIADLRRDEYITVMCQKPTMSELSFVRAVSAECWAWELTTGSRRGAFADGVNLVGRHAEGDAHRGRQSLGIAPLRAA